MTPDPSPWPLCSFKMNVWWSETEVRVMLRLAVCIYNCIDVAVNLWNTNKIIYSFILTPICPHRLAALSQSYTAEVSNWLWGGGACNIVDLWAQPQYCWFQSDCTGRPEWLQTQTDQQRSANTCNQSESVCNRRRSSPVFWLWCGTPVKVFQLNPAALRHYFCLTFEHLFQTCELLAGLRT